MNVLHAVAIIILNNFLLFIFIIVIFAENASFTPTASFACLDGTNYS